MGVPKLEDFTEEQRQVFLDVTQKRRQGGEKITVENVIGEYFKRDKVRHLFVKH